ELGDGAARGGFGCLASGIGVDLGIEDEDVDIAATGEHVIEAAIADIVGPAIAADDPDALFDEGIRHAEEVAGFQSIDSGKLRLELDDALALGEDALFSL